MRILSSLLCLLLPCFVVGQTKWQLMKSTRPYISEVRKSIGFKEVTVIENWHTDETNELNNNDSLRHIEHQRTTTYSNRNTKMNLMIKDVKYILLSENIELTIRAYLRDLKDTFYFRGSKHEIDGIFVDATNIEHKHMHYFDSTSFVINSIQERRKIFFKAVQKQTPRRLYFSIGASYMPAIANRHLSFTATTSDLYQAYSTRDGAEYAAYGSAVELRLGLNLGYRHGILITPFYMRQGFYAEDYTVDFSTGLPHAVPGKWRYAVDYLGVGLGYRYSGEQNKFNPVIELGAYLMWQNHEKYETTNTELNLKKEITGTEKTAVGLRVGLGLNYRPGYRFEAFMVPSIYYNVTALHRGRINTTLYNIGLNTGISYYFIRLWR